MHYILRFLAEAPLCAFWCATWHYVLHTKDHKSKAKYPKANVETLAWAISNHDLAEGKYGHKGSFLDCPYPVCEGERRDNGFEGL